MREYKFYIIIKGHDEDYEEDYLLYCRGSYKTDDEALETLKNLVDNYDLTLCENKDITKDDLVGTCYLITDDGLCDELLDTYTIMDGFL